MESIKYGCKDKFADIALTKGGGIAACRAYQKRYYESSEGIAARKRYYERSKGIATRKSRKSLAYKQWNETPEGIAAEKRYNESPKGIASQIQ